MPGFRMPPHQTGRPFNQAPYQHRKSDKFMQKINTRFVGLFLMFKMIDIQRQ